MSDRLRFAAILRRRRMLMLIGCALAGAMVDVAAAQLAFKRHFGDDDLPGKSMGQTDLADLDRDGDLDFITGEQRGRIFWYEYRAANDWVRRDLGIDSPSDVGGVAHDVNRDGWIDFVAGGAWYENSGEPRDATLRRHVFDSGLDAVHDIVLADVDGDGQNDVLTMSDRNDLRWYAIPADPHLPWPSFKIGPPVHSGVSCGDLDRDGDVDVVRSNVWFENTDQGREWRMDRITEPWGAPEPPFAVNATQTEVCDLNQDGRLDVVISDGENPDSKIAWIQAPEDPRSNACQVRHLPRVDDARTGALHSLKVADFDRDGDVDIFTVEMERLPGSRPPRWFLWENVDGRGKLVPHVILDSNLGGHEAVVGDVDGDQDIDIVAKPWSPRRASVLGGKNHFDYLENVTPRR
ncbi:MAG: VCBS repeat-containing protein [Planctomycetota bacterium]